MYYWYTVSHGLLRATQLTRLRHHSAHDLFIGHSESSVRDCMALSGKGSSKNYCHVIDDSSIMNSEVFLSAGLQNNTSDLTARIFKANFPIWGLKVLTYRIWPYHAAKHQPQTHIQHDKGGKKAEGSRSRVMTTWLICNGHFSTGTGD